MKTSQNPRVIYASDAVVLYDNSPDLRHLSPRDAIAAVLLAMGCEWMPPPSAPKVAFEDRDEPNTAIRHGEDVAPHSRES